jgi:hypothetical protein
MNLLLCFSESDFYLGGHTWPVSSLYINGKWVANTLNAAGVVTLDRPQAIGARGSAEGTYPSERHSEGLVHDVRIYDVRLSEDDVKTLFQERNDYRGFNYRTN